MPSSDSILCFLNSMIFDRDRSQESEKGWNAKADEHSAVEPATATSRLDRDQARRMATIYRAEVDVLNRTISDFRETFSSELPVEES